MYGRATRAPIELITYEKKADYKNYMRFYRFNTNGYWKLYFK